MTSEYVPDPKDFFKKITSSSGNDKSFVEIVPLFVYKKVLIEGFGKENPKEGDEISVNYIGELPDGRNIDNTYIHKDPHQLILGGNSIVYGLELGIKTMKVGEKSIFRIEPEYGYLPLEKYKLKENETKYFNYKIENISQQDYFKLEPTEAKKYLPIEYELELLFVDKPRKQKESMSTIEKVEAASELKLKGVDRFKEKYYQEACTIFSIGLEYLVKIPSCDLNQVEDIRHSLILNITNSLLHMNQYGYAVKKIEEAFKIKVNAKCYYYRAIARMHMADFESAEEDIHKLYSYVLESEGIVLNLKNKLKLKREEYERQTGKIIKSNLSSLYKDRIIESGSVFPKFSQSNKVIYLDLVINDNTKSPIKLKFEIYNELWAEDLIRLLSTSNDYDVLRYNNEKYEFLNYDNTSSSSSDRIISIYNKNNERLYSNTNEIKSIKKEFDKNRKCFEEEMKKENPNYLKLKYIPLFPCSEPGLLFFIQEIHDGIERLSLSLSTREVLNRVSEEIYVIGKCFYNNECLTSIKQDDKVLIISKGISLSLGN